MLGVGKLTCHSDHESGKTWTFSASVLVIASTSNKIYDTLNDEEEKSAISRRVYPIVDSVI